MAIPRYATLRAVKTIVLVSSRSPSVKKSFFVLVQYLVLEFDGHYDIPTDGHLCCSLYTSACMHSLLCYRAGKMRSGVVNEPRILMLKVWNR